MSSKNYFDFVTIAKGFAIICVVLGHFTPAYMPPAFHQLKEAVYLFHMPLFMVLAGFLFAHSMTKSDGQVAVMPFLGKKFRRLMVPYFFLSFAIAALNGVLQQFIPVKQQVNTTYLYRLFYENVGGSATFLWFLYTLFIIFGLSVVSRRLPGGNYALIVVACILPFLHLPSVFYLNAVGTYLLYFISGRWLYRYWMRHTSVSWITAAAAVCTFAVAYSCYTIITGPALKPVLSYLCGFSACLFILFLSRWLSKKKAWSVSVLRSTGTYSSFIYLLHMAGVYPIRLCYEKISWHTPFSYLIFLLLAIFAGCLLPVITRKYVLNKSTILLFLMGESKKLGKNLVRKEK